MYFHNHSKCYVTIEFQRSYYIFRSSVKIYVPSNSYYNRVIFVQQEYLFFFFGIRTARTETFKTKCEATIHWRYVKLKRDWHDVPSILREWTNRGKIHIPLKRYCNICLFGSESPKSNDVDLISFCIFRHTNKSDMLLYFRRRKFITFK